jgi:serine O-acetyltransferase
VRRRDRGHSESDELTPASDPLFDATELTTGRHYVDDTKTERLSILEPIWARIREDAERIVTKEPALAAFLTANVLRFHSFDGAASDLLAERLAETTFPAARLRALCEEAFNRSLALCNEVAEDHSACLSRLGPGTLAYALLLYDAGFVGLMAQRFVRWIWHTDRRELAVYLAARVTSVFGVDVHPRAEVAGGLAVAAPLAIGAGVSIERGVSIGRNVVIEADGSGAPWIRDGAVLGHGVYVVGKVTIGRKARVAAGSTVLTDVAPHAFVAGSPARPLGK